MSSDIDIVEEINDGSLYLRKIKKKDAELFYTNYFREKTVESAKRFRRYLKWWDAYPENYAQYHYIIEIRESDIKSVGSINFWNLNWRHRRGEIGVWIIPSCRNKGFGKKSLNLIKNIGFFHLKLNRIEAHIAPKNEISINLFEKCGFRKEGILEQYWQDGNEYRDALVFVCLRDEHF